MSDYVTDTKSVLDNSLRVLQAILDIAADAGWLRAVLATVALVQALVQVGLSYSPGIVKPVLSFRVRVLGSRFKGW